MRRVAVLSGLGVILIGFAVHFVGLRVSTRAYAAGKPGSKPAFLTAPQPSHIEAHLAGPKVDFVDAEPVLGEIVGLKRADQPVNPRVAKYLLLLSRKAQRLSDDELDKAIDELTRTLTEQDEAAQSELNGIVESLNALAKRFPGTPAALKATGAVAVLQGEIGGPVAEPAQAAPALDDFEAFAVPIR